MSTDACREPRAHGPKDHLARKLHDLSREECLQLLSAATFGRVVVSGKSDPIIRPVSYAFDEPSQSVVFRTAQGSKLHALLRSARAVFEIDGIDTDARTGWSVIIVGVTEEVTNESEVRRLESIGIDPWAPGPKGHWIRIRAWTVSGRRISVRASDAERDRARPGRP